MKRIILNALAIATITIGAVACKGEKKNETEATSAKEVAKAAQTATTFNVDTAASTINWVGSKPTESHSGTIDLQSGSVQVAGDKITGDFVIDMNSITVKDLKPGDGKENLEGHLKGMAEGKEDHFFNVAKYPTATFQVTGVTRKDSKLMMQGNLTIRDISKNIEFPVSYSLQGSSMELKSEKFNINRTDWGVNYGSKSIFDNLGDKFISDDIELQITLKAAKA
jgi:polyisoprenoid-binding protein YceI